MRLIKRYPNRKLYDTHTKQYITLKEIAELIKQDHEISIMDNSTGEDITAVTLAQIILGYEKEVGGVVPRILFSDLIQYGSEKLLAHSRVNILQNDEGIDEFAARILNRLNVPTQADFLRLEEQLEDLAAKLDSLEETI